MGIVRRYTAGMDPASSDGETVDDIGDVAEFDEKEEAEAPPDEAEQEHQKIIARAAKAAADKPALQRLVRDHLDEMARPTRDNRTFLHTAAAKENPPERFATAIKQVLAFLDGAKLLGVKDNDSKTPLYIAINDGNKSFLRAVTSWPQASITMKRISSILEAAEGALGETTSLHLAVTKKNKISHAILLDIIQMVPKTMLRVRDAGGHTPLHLAVEHSRCTGEQLAVVRALIERDSSVLEMTTNKEHSVYQHHVHSRPPATSKNGNGRWPSKHRAPTSRAPNSRSASKQPDARGGKPEAGPPTKPGKPGSVVKENANGLTPDFDLRLGGRKPTTLMTAWPEVPTPAATNTPIDPQPGALAPSKHAQWQGAEAVANQIRNELKLQSLRGMPCDVASRCLNIDKKKEKHLWFDYVPSPQTQMTFREFGTHWAHLDFDTTLQYVALPNVTFRRDPDEDKLHRRSRDDATRIFGWLADRGVNRILRVIVHEPVDAGGGHYHSNEAIESSLRNLHVEMLDWCRPDICPSTIVSIGQDLRELRLHWSGNNAMLRAWSELQGLPILSKYKKLRLIRIVVPKDGPDIGASTQTNLGAFKTRLETNWTIMAEFFGKVWEKRADGKAKETNGASTEQSTEDSRSVIKETKHQLLEKLLEGLTETAPWEDGVIHPGEAKEGLDRANGMAQNGINGASGVRVAPRQPPVHSSHIPRVEVDDSSGRHSLTSYEADDGLMQRAAPESGIEQHRWIECMKDFSRAFKEVPQPNSDEMAANPKLAPVKIALIDDGVDTTDPALRGRTYGGKSLDFYDGRRRSQPYWVSTSGHGTIMAKLIRSVCPTAEIYVIKLNTEACKMDLDKLSINTDSAIEAIHHALDQDAKIISMSWSVEVPPAGSDEQKRWQGAIHRAINSQAVLLCAASDQGEAGDQTYPYAANKGHIFGIGAATPNARPADYVKPGDIHFLFPGHDVLLKDESPRRRLGDVQHGSSIATALAAGLAALVLECVRLGHLAVVRAQWRSRELPPSPIWAADVDLGAEGMKSVFRRMCDSSQGYLRVWEWFKAEDNETLRDGTPDERLEHIATLARKFLNLK